MVYTIHQERSKPDSGAWCSCTQESEHELQLQVAALSYMASYKFVLVCSSGAKVDFKLLEDLRNVGVRMSTSPLQSCPF